MDSETYMMVVLQILEETQDDPDARESALASLLDEAEPE